MRVLMINKFLHPNGGSETYIFKLGNYLELQGHKVQYFGMDHKGRCVNNAVNAYTTDMDFHNGSRLSKILYPIKTIYSFEARRKIRLVLNDFQPDVCHINNFNYQLTPTIILEINKWREQTGNECKIIFTAHDYQLICPNHMCKNPKTHENCEKCLGGNFINCTRGKCIHGSTVKSLIGTVEATFWKMNGVYKYIDAMICCSYFMKTKLDMNSLFEKKTITLHNFIDKVEWKEDVKKDYVLYFGRFAEEKGISTLLKVCGELPDVNFVFAGTGSLDVNINNIKNIVNVGFKKGEELERLIREAIFSIYPSEWYENCPFAVMESQMYGTPVLGAAIGGIPELIRVGETGELFESGNAADLKFKIRKLWENKSLTDIYSKNCMNTSFDTIDAYYKKLMIIYTEGKSSIKQASSIASGDKDMSKSKGKKTKKLNGTVIVTYRCNARCNMCNRYKKPSKAEEEISLEIIRKLPQMYFTNITGGEPFMRTDLKDIVRELYKKSDRIVISTNGFFTNRIVDLCEEFPQIGIRISIEGLEETNNKIRGLENGYERGYSTLKKLRKMGMKDVGFGMTIQDCNCKDLIPLYKISEEMDMEFATATLHNSFYFVEAKNIIKNRPKVAKQIENLVNELLKSNSPKKWFRAYFNHGLINYLYGQKRILPCDMSFDTFFIDPYGDVMPCNGTEDKAVMGNLNEQVWDELWNSKEAENVRQNVRSCIRDCWMIGSVSPAMHKYIWKPAFWVVQHKFLRFFKEKKYSMNEHKIVRDYKKGLVRKEELDKCSTYNKNVAVKDGLSAVSKERLFGEGWEEIINTDIEKKIYE